MLCLRNLSSPLSDNKLKKEEKKEKKDRYVLITVGLTPKNKVWESAGECSISCSSLNKHSG